MLISRKLLCVALVVLVSCSSENARDTGPGAVGSAPAKVSDAQSTQSPFEIVYVVRSRFSSPNLPVTSFCDAAQFPSDYPVERERHYKYWSTNARSTDGAVVDGAVQRLGEHHGCYSVNKNEMIYCYMTGTFADMPFTARGTCVFNPERAPEPGVTPYTCNYAMSDLPNGYVGGQSTWNGVTTDDPGYLTTTIGTVRLWKGSPAR
jgi:hypothetical protein